MLTCIFWYESHLSISRRTNQTMKKSAIHSPKNSVHTVTCHILHISSHLLPCFLFRYLSHSLSTPKLSNPLSSPKNSKQSLVKLSCLGPRKRKKICYTKKHFGMNEMHCVAHIGCCMGRIRLWLKRWPIGRLWVSPTVWASMGGVDIE